MTKFVKALRNAFVFSFLIFIIILFMVGKCHAQLNGNFKTVRFVNVLDSATVLPINGSIYYNEQSAKFRVYSANGWHDLGTGNGGGNVTGTFTPNQLAYASGIHSLTTNSKMTFNSISGPSFSNLTLGTGTPKIQLQATGVISITNGGTVFNLTNTGDISKIGSINSTATAGNSTTFKWDDGATESGEFNLGIFSGGLNIISYLNTGAAGQSSQFNAVNGQLQFFSDVTNFPGVKYTADFSANFADRSLIDRGYLRTFTGSTTLGTGEIPQWNGTAFGKTEIYSLSPNGNVQLGTTSLSGTTRTITTKTSASQADLTLDVDQSGAGTVSIIGREQSRDGYRTSNPAGTFTGSYLKFETVSIGSWNMQTTASITVAHGISPFSKIVMWDISIINDAGNAIYKLTNGDGTPTTLQGGSFLDVTNVTLARPAGSQFNAAGFSGSGNRGFILIYYTP